MPIDGDSVSNTPNIESTSLTLDEFTQLHKLFVASVLMAISAGLAFTAIFDQIITQFESDRFIPLMVIGLFFALASATVEYERTHQG